MKPLEQTPKSALANEINLKMVIFSALVCVVGVHEKR